MGSSKKHKEREKESRKKRRRSRSRSREHERRKDREHDHHSSKYRYRERSLSDHEGIRYEKSSKSSKYSRRSPNYEDDIYEKRNSSKYKYKDRSSLDDDDSDHIEILKQFKPSKSSRKSPANSEDESRIKHSSSVYKYRDREPSEEEFDSRRAVGTAQQRLPNCSLVSASYEDDEITIINDSNSGPILEQSIEDTNKMRVKLGLKPLDVTPSEGASGSTDSKQEVFVRTENISAKKKTEALREKLEAQREKRKIQSKMRKVKGLADSDSEDNAMSWVNKSRKLEKEKEIAAERAKVLEEMDEEFGIGNLIEEEFTKTKENLYTSKNLSGMNVGHSKNLFKDGASVILTLKDKDVLAEDEDVLQNVNLLDDEHGMKNIDNKKKLGGYKPYDEPEYDEYGQLITKDILDKYDEEITGPKKDNFRLGSGGKIDLRREAEIKSMKVKLQKKQTETLSLPEPVLASEFYTTSEMVQFRKTKKKVRKVRKKTLKADDLEPLTELTNDHGSRGKKSEAFQKFKQTWESGMDNKYNNDDMEIVVQPSLDSNDFHNQEQLRESDVGNVMVEEDQAEADLQQALNKARKLKQLAKQTTGIEKVAKAVQMARNDNDSNRNGEGNFIVMNETAEFCRVLGDIPTYGQSGNREDEEDIMEMEEAERPEEDQQSDVPRGAWNEVEIDDQPVNIEPPDEGPILEEEPVVGLGIAGALQLATQKGYLDKEVKKATMSAKQANLQAANYTIEDKNYEDEKIGNRRTDRFISGPINEFKDKASYKPDIKLDYIDDSGRILSQKEAFRYLSHKFHGKGPGKIKTEKRVKKQEEDVLLRQMSSTDTPLKTLSMLQDKQKETQSPYVILSGGSKALQSNSLSKTK